MLFIRDFFWTLSGGDKIIIEKCDVRTRMHFALLGISVFLILLLCFVACWFSFKNLFHSNLTGFFMACFFALLIFNLYLLMQTTISRNFLPVPEDVQITSKLGKILSLSIRLGFIAFLSVVVAKPIEEMFFSYKMDEAIAQFKEREILRHGHSLSRHYQEEKSRLETALAQYKALRDEKNVQRMNDELKSSLVQYEASLLRIRRISGESEYFLQRIRILCTDHPVSWMITFGFSCLFFLPVAIKFIISDKSGNYYRLKCEVDKSKILDHYHAFKKEYSGALLSACGKRIAFEENHDEPPFNIRPKQDKRAFLGQDALLDLLYGKQ